MSDVDPAGLDVGACFEFPEGDRLVVVGVLPADEVPDKERDGPLYQAEIRGETLEGTFLYGPHNIEQGLAAGVEYIGQVAVETERTPFWCDGCQIPHMAEERHDTTLLDVDVCSYGCKVKARQAERQQRRDGR